jgi:hypothetical protein
MTDGWVDVSYTKKSGVWEKNLLTGELREVKEEAAQPTYPVASDCLETVESPPPPKVRKTRAKRSAEGDK